MATPSARPARSLLRTRRPPGTASTGVPRIPLVPVRRQRRWLFALVLVVVAGAAAAGTWLVVDGRVTTPLAATSTVTVTPSPALAPVPRAAGTAFAAKLPSTVRQYALVSSSDNLDWLAAGALEAYLEEFGDGRSATLTLRAGQWTTVEEATDAFAAFTAGAEPPKGATGATTGPVLVGGAEVGRYVVADAGSGNATLTWFNATAVLQLMGPVAEVERTFEAFPV